MLVIGIRNSGLALILGWRIDVSQLMRNFPNPSCQYSKRQTRAKEMEKCLDECLEPTHYFSIFSARVIITE